MTTCILGGVLAAILGALGGLHLYWAAGGRWGAGAVIPVKEDGAAVFRPRLPETVAVGLVLAACAAFVLARAGLFTVGLPKVLGRYGLPALGAVFLLRAVGEGRYVGLFKKVRTTRFSRMDTRYYTPLCGALGLGLLALAALVR